MEFSTFAADSHQTPNVPGIRRFWKIRRKAFTGSWPVLADTTTGEITADPFLKLPEYFVAAEYIVPQNTKDAKFTNLPELGYDNYQHSFDYEMAGMTKDLMAEIMKNRNSDNVYIVEDTDQQLWVLGTSNRGLVETISGGFGKLGNDKRGLTITATNDGFMWPPLPLSENTKIDFNVRQQGYGPFFQNNIYLNYTFTMGSTKTLRPGNANGETMPLIFDGVFGVRAGVAWKYGDIILLTKGHEGTLSSPPRLSRSLRHGWCKVEVTSFSDNGFMDLTVVEIGAGNGFTSNFSVFHQDRPKFTGLTRFEEPTNGYFGQMSFNYTGGTLPYVAGDSIFIQYCSGTGPVIKVSGQFVSQVGTTVNIEVSVSEVLFFGGELAATTGYEIMEDVIFV